MDEKFSYATFEHFKPTKYNERNLKLCRRYAEKFDLMLEKNQGLLFWGDVGTGKSYAAACIANYLLDRKAPVIMTSFVKLLEVIQASRGGTGDPIQTRICQTVIFDDLGAERGYRLCSGEGLQHHRQPVSQGAAHAPDNQPQPR